MTQRGSLAGVGFLFIGLVLGAVFLLLRQGPLTVPQIPNAPAQQVQLPEVISWPTSYEASVDIGEAMEATFVSEEALQLNLATAVANGGYAPNGVDWERFARNFHVSGRHEKLIAECIAQLAMHAGWGEVWQSNRLTVRNKFNGNFEFPAIVYRRDLGDALRILRDLGKLGSCGMIDTNVLQREFGRGNTLKLTQFTAVAVFGKKTRDDMSTVLFPVTLYFVPTYDWEAFRCEWHLTVRLYPAGLFPCVVE